MFFCFDFFFLLTLPSSSLPAYVSFFREDLAFNICFDLDLERDGEDVPLCSGDLVLGLF